MPSQYSSAKYKKGPPKDSYAMKILQRLAEARRWMKTSEFYDMFDHNFIRHGNHLNILTKLANSGFIYKSKTPGKRAFMWLISEKGWLEVMKTAVPPSLFNDLYDQEVVQTLLEKAKGL